MTRFYFIPGHPNPTVASANRYLHGRKATFILRTRKQTNKKTNAIDFRHTRTEGALRAIRRPLGSSP